MENKQEFAPSWIKTEEQAKEYLIDRVVSDAGFYVELSRVLIDELAKRGVLIAINQTGLSMSNAVKLRGDSSTQQTFVSASQAVKYAFELLDQQNSPSEAD